MDAIKLTVLGFVPYKFKDEKEGKEVKGTTVWFIEEHPQNDEYGQGFIPRKITMPYEFKDELDGVVFPYQCEPTMATRFTSKGPKTVIDKFKLVAPVKITVDKIVVR